MKIIRLVLYLMALINTYINLIYCGSISKLLLIHFASMYI